MEKLYYTIIHSQVNQSKVLCDNIYNMKPDNEILNKHASGANGKST